MISVIIPCYNSSLTIRSCILSVINTGYIPMEIIVVDDASTDDSTDIVKELCYKYNDFLKIIEQITHHIHVVLLCKNPANLLPSAFGNRIQRGA